MNKWVARLILLAGLHVIFFALLTTGGNAGTPVWLALLMPEIVMSAFAIFIAAAYGLYYLVDAATGGL